MKLRRAVTQDASALAELEKTQPQAAGWGEQGLRTELQQTCSIIWCAQAADEVVGFVAARAVADSAEIVNIAVRADQVRRGIGKALLGEILAVLKAKIKKLTSVR